MQGQRLLKPEMTFGADGRGAFSLLPTEDEDSDQRHGYAFELGSEEEDFKVMAPWETSPPHLLLQLHAISEEAARNKMFRFVNSTWWLVLSSLASLVSGVALILERELAGTDWSLLYWIECVLAGWFCAEWTIQIVHHGFKTLSGISERVLLAWCHLIVTCFALLAVLGMDANNVTPWMNAAAFGGRAVLAVYAALRALCEASCSWAESAWFQSTVGLVIATNAIIMGCETDIKTPVWWYIEQALVFFFVIELSIRLRLQGRSFFTSPTDRCWNVLDLMIVVSGVLDQWVMQAWHNLMQRGASRSSFGEMMMLARMMRLMRIMRLVRVVKAIRPLHDLAVVLARAMQSMFWVLVLTFIALYSLAILTTQMIGQGIIEANKDRMPEATAQMFGSIADSMFTLFAIMNGQDFNKLEPLLEIAPWLKPIFVVFTIYCSWALLSVMAGVVSDHMRSVRIAQQLQDEEASEELHAQRIRILTEVFSTLDVDGDGRLTETEFHNLANSSFHLKRMEQLCIPVDDLETVFHCLDCDESGTVELDELIEILEWLSEPVTGRQLIRVDAAVKFKTSQANDQLDETQRSFDNLKTLMAQQRKEILQDISDLLGPSKDCGASQSFQSPTCEALE
eukprot:TRINITY_DN16906_c0_g1_i2.p1 TRINITY_DN16906_c0_g1~~TRINITY_DN16906_c0_g1_i2.p1  ORF type:complete len:623 (-),score=92.20 TRINITY_DN16906_c0_g1_i2:226-2094(-)